MNFFKGIFSALIIYGAAAAVFRWGYIRGVESESYSRKMANNRLVSCNSIIMGGSR
jgi:hypothetical protein